MRVASRAVALLALVALADTLAPRAGEAAEQERRALEEELENADLSIPQYTFTALWCAGFCCAFAAPLALGLYPEADSMDGTLIDSFVVDQLRWFLPFGTIFLDMMQVASIGFLPSIRWDAKFDWSFYQWWSWGLYWNGEFQVGFFLTLFVVSCCVTPCVIGWRQLSESVMVKLFTNTLAMTVFNIIFSGLACSTDGGPANAEPIDGWGLPSGSCNRGMSQMMVILAFFAATYFGCLVVVAGVKAMHEDDWPRGVYCFLYDAFVNHALLALYGALLGFSGRAKDGIILRRLLLCVCCVSSMLQVIAKPQLRHSPRLHACRLTAEFFKLIISIAANVPNGGGYLVIVVSALTLMLGMMSVGQVCCCCLVPVDDSRRAKYEITIGVAGAPPAPDHDQDGGEVTVAVKDVVVNP